MAKYGFGNWECMNLWNEDGRAVPNQFVITDGKVAVFQSYNSTVCAVADKKVVLGRDWDYSRTTTRWLMRFLRLYADMDFRKSDEIRKAISDGVIEYDAEM